MSGRGNFPTFRRMSGAVIRGLRWTVRRTWKPALALVAGVLVVQAVLMVVWGRQLEQELAKLRRSGKPVTCADLVPKPIPDSENGAVLYQRAFETLKAGESREMVGSLYLDSLEFNAKWKPAVKEYVRRNAQVFPLLKQAASKPACIFPIDWEAGPGALFPTHLSPCAKLTSLVAYRARLDSEEGRMDEALDGISLVVRMSESLAKEPTLISYLAGTRQVNLGTTALMTSTSSHPLTTAQARRMYDTLSSVELGSGLTRALDAERVTMIQWFGKVRSDPPAAALYASIYLPSGESRAFGLTSRFWYRGTAYLWRPFSYKDQMIALEVWAERLEAYKMPYRLLGNLTPKWDTSRLTSTILARLVAPGSTELQSTNSGSGRSGRPLPSYAILARLTTPAATRIVRYRDATMAEIGLAQTAMALKAYKSKFGSYPESLPELKSKLGWKIPDDPLSGKPFIYRRQGEGFLIYSLGQNLKDDGGKFTKTYSEEGDIVWTSDI